MTRIGVWLGPARGVPITDRYPCLCAGLGVPCPTPAFKCPCWGRTDIEHVPSYCCGRRHRIHTAEHRQAPWPIRPLSDEPEEA